MSVLAKYVVPSTSYGLTSTLSCKRRELSRRPRNSYTHREQRRWQDTVTSSYNQSPVLTLQVGSPILFPQMVRCVRVEFLRRAWASLHRPTSPILLWHTFRLWGRKRRWKGEGRGGEIKDSISKMGATFIFPLDAPEFKVITQCAAPLTRTVCKLPC